MDKIWKIFQYAYLVIAIIFLVEGILKWNLDRQESYLFFGFSIFITLVFFFKRHFRKKIKNRNHQKK